MKDAYALPRGTLPPVVIREPESEKYQPLPEVPGKCKAKVTEEQSDSEEESEKVVLGAEEGGQNEGQAGPNPDDQAEDQTRSDAGAQVEDQTGSDAGAQAEGQAGSNPDEASEGQVGSNSDETSEGRAGPDPGDAKAKVQSIPSPVVHARSDREHMDLDVANVSPQPSTEQLDEGDFSFGDQIFSDKPSDADKNAETKVKSMVNVTIQQALSSISLMTSPIIDLTSRPESPKEHQQLKATTTNTTTTFPPPQAPQQSTTDAMMVKRIGELKHIMADLIQVNKDMEERLDNHGSRLYTLEQLDIPQQVSIVVSEVVTNAVDWDMQAPLRNRFRDLPEADMKEILHQRMWESESYKSHEDHMQLFEALEKSMNRDHSKELAQDLAEARKKKKKSHESSKMPPGSPSHQPPPPPPPAGSATPRPLKTAASAEYQAWTTTNIRLRPSISLTPEDLEIDEDMALDEQAQSSDDEDIGSAHIPTSGRPHTKSQRQQTTTTGWSTWSSHNPIRLLLQQRFEYLRYDSKGRRPALSISKMKAAYYLYAGLEQMVPDQFWIEEECKYDIAAIIVRTHMWILSIVRIKVFSMYGYDYMKKIVLCRANLNEYVIAKRDFKYLYPSDFEDLHLLKLQGHLNHLPPKDKKILTTPMMMRVNEIHKFSDGTLQQIDEALDYRIKEFRINRMNPGLNTRFWTRKDMDRSKAFMFAIQRRLKTRMIFRNLESFVGGRVREGDYRLLKRTE
nr:hypothetical protein [Tanacetum cinerariifolium]